MSLDMSTLTFLRQRGRYERLVRAIPERALDARTKVLLSDFGRYFREFPGATEVTFEPFFIMFCGIHKKLSDEDVAVYKQIINTVCKGALEEAEEDSLKRRLHEAATAFDVAQLLVKYEEGQEVDLRRDLQGFMDQYDTVVDRKIKNPQVLDKIEDLLEAEADDHGLSWRWSCLNRSMKPLVGGDFVIVAARPDKGKTTMLSDNLTYMAAQVDLVYPGEKRSILWFNNEGPGKRIVTRNFQSALNATIEDLIALSAQPADPEFADYKTMVRQKYAEALGGRPGVLRVFDVHDLWTHDVEDLMNLHKPAVVVFDMIDNIKFSGAAANNGQRTDQLLEEMYKWARNLAVKFDCAALATSQVSNDGDGMQYPTLGMLKDSKTGKQGAADAIITLGSVNDPMLATSRYIGLTKNKKNRTGGPQSPMQELIIDGSRGRYLETPT